MLVSALSTGSRDNAREIRRQSIKLLPLEIIKCFLLSLMYVNVRFSVRVFYCTNNNLICHIAK